MKLITIAIGGLEVTADREATLITHGLGSCIAVCVYPVASVALDSMRCVPGVACQSMTHCRHVSIPGTAARVACRHCPPSTRTSTASMPLCCAHATPAIFCGPAFTCPTGTSIRDSVLIGA